MKNFFSGEYFLGVAAAFIIGFIAVLMKNINNPTIVIAYNLFWFIIGFFGMLTMAYMSNKYNKQKLRYKNRQI